MRGYFGQAYFGGSPAVAAGGPPTGAGTVTVTYVLAGTGQKRPVAAGTVTLAEALTGVGQKRATAAGTITLAEALAGSGTRRTSGAGTLGVSYALSGAGSVPGLVAPGSIREVSVASATIREVLV